MASLPVLAEQTKAPLTTRDMQCQSAALAMLRIPGKPLSWFMDHVEKRIHRDIDFPPCSMCGTQALDIYMRAKKNNAPACVECEIMFLSMKKICSKHF